MTHQSDTGSVAVGFVSSLGLGKIFGVISYNDLVSSFLLGAVGAVAGWMVKNCLSYLGKKIEKYKRKKQHKKQ